MASLFDDEFRYTLEAEEVDREVSMALRPIFERALIAGRSPRDVAYIVAQIAGVLSCETVLRAQVALMRRRVTPKDST